jgi:hypothetical protein
MPRSLSFTFSHPALHPFLFPTTCHMPCPSHPPWFDHTNIWSGIQIMILFIMHFCSCLLSLSSSNVH